MILVIDDDVQLRNAVKEIFDLLGADSLIAGDGMEGIDLFRRHQPDITTVMIDWRMPGMSGLETYHAVRNEAPKLPIVIASGDDDIDRATLAVGDSAIEFLRKPYSLDDLADLVQRQ